MKEKIVFINNLRINYKIAGDGPVILILHGWGGSSDSWLSVQQILAENGYKVICPDLPGFGKSSFPSKGWEVTDYTNFILSFTKAVNLENFFLLGHSLGGGLSTKFTVLFPEKIRALILCDAAVIRNKKKFNFRQRFAFFLTKSSYPLFSTPFFKKIIYPLARKIIYKIAGTSDYYLAKGTMKETFKKVSNEDLTNLAAQIKIPTLIIWGKKDKTLSLENGIALGKIIPNSKIEIIEGADHNPHRKKPEQLSEIILKFLKARL